MDSESPEPIVSLNVGGKKFTTSRETLCKVSNSLNVSGSCGIPTRLCLRVQLAASAQQLCCLPPEKLSIASRSVTTNKLCRVECVCNNKFERVLANQREYPLCGRCAGRNIHAFEDVQWEDVQQTGRKGTRGAQVSFHFRLPVEMSVSLSLLSVMLDIREVVQGRVFLDRDPKHFRLILNYLRDGSVCLPSCSMELHEIIQEAMFYQVQICFQSSCMSKLYMTIML